jgi:penicillin amidase
LALVLAALGAVPAALLWRAWRAVPAMTGTQALPGLGEAVEIVRDAHAIPHIYAQSARDAYLALGYVHAQDRLWQMEFARRVGSGRLSELLGERGLEADRLFRTLGVVDAARASLAALLPETREALRAYTAGVNAWLASAEPLPVEFAALQHTPERWRELDSVVVMKVMAWQLSGNWSNELRRLSLGAQLGPTQLAQFESPGEQGQPVAFEQLWKLYEQLGIKLARSAPGLPGEQPGNRGARGSSRQEPLESLATLTRELGRFAPSRLGRAIGSNNWAVDGARSATGKPLLANDPHLELNAPSQWYFAHLEAPQLKVIGATIPALPGVILGRTGQVAWAFTNMAPDTQDLYFEKLVGQSEYLTPTGPEAFDEKRELIRVRGGQTVELRVRRTRHGPVISDVSELAQQAAPQGFVLALAWAALARDDQTLDFPVLAGRAQNAEQLREATRHYHSPAQNVVYADTQGQIGFVGAGKIPLRDPASSLRGLVPAPGWLTEHDWSGFIPFDELPQVRQPESGSLVTANQNTQPPGYPHWIGSDFGPPHRAERIGAMLAATPRHSVQSFQVIQSDRHSTLASLLLEPMLRALGPPEAAMRERVEELRRWHGEAEAGQRAPLVFAAWLRELTRRVYQDELGESLFMREWEGSPEFLARVLSDHEGHSVWCDDVNTPRAETCRELAGQSLLASLAYLSARLGEDVSQWSWGAVHSSLASHKLFGGLPVLGGLFNLRAPRGGDGTTVDVGSYAWDDDEFAFENDWGPGFRAIYDLADLDRSRGILNTGQSGHVMSPHYRDMHQAWTRGELLPLSTRQADVRRGSLGSLRLEPARGEVR